MFFGRNAIRQSQLEALVYSKMTSQQLKPIEYQKDEIIKDAEAISVLFSTPDNLEQKRIFQLIAQKEKELNRTIFVYPLVYQVRQISESYQLNSNETTIVFFEKGVEKNRFTFESIEEPKKNFIPELNRLPMWNMKIIEETENKQEEKNELTEVRE
ncbi:hypothetical protein ACYSNO_01180 [Enterococcus sp. LJL98]